VPAASPDGTKQQVFVVDQEAAHGGSPCAVAANDTQLVACHNSQPCPVNCTGSWAKVNGTCTATSCNSTGVVTERFVVTSPALNNGSCEAIHGMTRRVAPCYNNTPCPLPVDCQGSWLVQGCSTTQCSLKGLDVLLYVIAQPAINGGKECDSTNGTLKFGSACSIACPLPAQPPSDCKGVLVPSGSCSALCGGEDVGYMPWVYIIAAAAANGGANCSFSNGSTTYTQCTNNSTCPWDDVRLVDSQPLLKPVSTPLKKKFRIQAGNMSISGIKVEGTGGGTTAPKARRPRLSQLNGTLSFYTLDALVEVYGEFELQRSMRWTWDDSLGGPGWLRW